MAGSTITGGSTRSRKSSSSRNKTSDHPATGAAEGNAVANANGHGAANGSTYRVTIDVRKIQANVYANEGGRLSELAVRNWLRSVGFHPESGGRTWLGDRDSLSRLDKSEIVRTERVHGAPTRAG